MPRYASPSQVKLNLQILAETPGRIAACTAHLDEARLNAPITPGEWSIAMIMSHLRGSGEVRASGIYAMLAQDNPELPYIHPRDWIKQHNYNALSFADNFHAFSTGHEELLSTLQNLSIDQWNRSARVTGRLGIYTLFGEVYRMNHHDLDHIQQIETHLPPKP